MLLLLRDSSVRCVRAKRPFGQWSSSVSSRLSAGILNCGRERTESRCAIAMEAPQRIYRGPLCTFSHSSNDVHLSSSSSFCRLLFRGVCERERGRTECACMCPNPMRAHESFDVQLTSLCETAFDRVDRRRCMAARRSQLSAFSAMDPGREARGVQGEWGGVSTCASWSECT